MRAKRIFRIRLDDESHLRTIREARFSLPVAILAICIAVVSVISAAVAIIMLTPLHTLLPGYLSESQRVATEENLLRLDSLRQAYTINQAYIDNYLRVTDIDRTPNDSAMSRGVATNLTPDSLLPPLPAEQRFMSTMEERERYNISVLAPLAADGMMFSPVCSDGIFTADSRSDLQGIVLAPAGSPVLAPADGNVVALYYSHSEGGYAMVIQHRRGFLSAFSRLGSPLVAVGDAVNSGQVIALSPQSDRNAKHWFSIRLWHNSLPLVPYDYVGSGFTTSTTEDTYEAPRGR